jgi:malonyl-CoA O-methyltransferase
MTNTQMKKNLRIQFNFSKYAHVYDKHAQLQNKMAEKLASFLPNVMPEKVLEIGCGTGMFTKYLLAKPAKQIFLNDISDQMIKRMKLNLSLPPYIQIITGNAEFLKFKPVDMITANAVFQWFSDPRGILNRLKTCIKPNGRLVFSTFGPSSLKELRKIASLNSPIPLYSENKWIDLIKETGMNLSSSKKEKYKIFFPSALQLLKNLQQIGAAPTRMASSKELRRIINDYDQAYLTKQGVYANWELLYFSAINNQ